MPFKSSTQERTGIARDTLQLLKPLTQLYPNMQSVLQRIALLNAELDRPKPTIHVISDIHGQDDKLRHIINNVSGSLRWLVHELAGRGAVHGDEEQFLSLLFYPTEFLEWKQKCGEISEEFFEENLRNIFRLIGVLAADTGNAELERRKPGEYAELLSELRLSVQSHPLNDAFESIIKSLCRQKIAQEVTLLAVRWARDLTVHELIIAGDCWDRGPRGDRVVDILTCQPKIAFTWGNHDIAWLGALLGAEALVASVCRISLRYNRLPQLEEGYGISMAPLEELADQVYGHDPAERFQPRYPGMRSNQMVARMQKAIAIIQFKLEGQLIDRNPEFAAGSRKLLHTIDNGSLEIDGDRYELLDSFFPTLDHARPYELTVEEQACIDGLALSFSTSRNLRAHLRFLAGHGSMYLVRDKHLIFHGCIPVNEDGEPLPLHVNGKNRTGQNLFDSLNHFITEAFDSAGQEDLDFLWYLWCGPRSPLFGKDKICTFENDFVKDEATRAETKNPYFSLIHDKQFCQNVLEAFGVDPKEGIIVNGHVPVKIDHGESPLKRSGQAVTIDGAFSEAYGDRGYTLVLEPRQTFLAEHSHFESVAAAVEEGSDIIPELTTIRSWETPRRISETEQGEEIEAELRMLEQLKESYRRNQLHQKQ